ncbi:hypothetical protein MMC06_005078 [Schaereria dolodes]|nr:hypothetical protein [Schaereria dolodes]
MTGSMTVSSLLPTVKCSNCNAEIEISQMGDHTCLRAPLRPQASRFNSAFASLGTVSKGPASLKHGKGLPPRIDSSTANRSYVGPGQTTTDNITNHIRTALPLSSWTTPKSPFRAPSRSATSPLPHRPPSPDRPLPQDCAFPSFPTTKSSSSASRNRRPSVSAANRPLHEIGSSNLYKSYRSQASEAVSPARNRNGSEDSRSASRNESRTDRRLDDAPPVPAAATADAFSFGNPYHAPTESTSSSDSSSSEVHTSSSRSSPPLSNASFGSKITPPDASGIDASMDGVPKSIGDMNRIDPPEVRRALPYSFSRPLYVRPMDISVQYESNKQPAESPMDPAIQYGRLPSTISPSNSAPQQQSFIKPIPLETDRSLVDTPYTMSRISTVGTYIYPAPPLEHPSSAPPARRPTTANKGNCRGCGELIQGKSVSSADGRLTGRYHKHCFVCKTCKEPFQTADFYVMDNHPYCSRHYHQLNGSLCKTCDRGIEGQYLETEAKQKFHPHCFTCQDCHKILRDEYFELNGKTYCEQHTIYQNSQQASLLGPGRRYPERRTTRLMMI